MNNPLKKQQKFGIGILHMVCHAELCIVYDKYTLDYPIARVHIGLARKNQVYYGKDQKLLGVYHCHGIVIDVQLWFFKFFLLLTPFCILQKQPE